MGENKDWKYLRYVDLCFRSRLKLTHQVTAVQQKLQVLVTDDLTHGAFHPPEESKRIIAMIRQLQSLSYTTVSNALYKEALNSCLLLIISGFEKLHQLRNIDAAFGLLQLRLPSLELVCGTKD